MTLTDKVIVSSQTVARQVGDETVILHLGSCTYYSLDSVGARIWQLIEEGRTLKEICDVVVDEYEVLREDVERDIRSLINDLLAHDLVGAS